VKTWFQIALWALVLVVTSSRCLALRSIGILTPAEAKTMGVEVRFTPAGPDAVWLELEFKAEGRLKEYNPERSSHVEIEVRDGGKSMVSYAALQEHRPKLGVVRVRFMANRGYLDKLVLTIVVGDGAQAGGAYEILVKDFWAAR
jgi:hypothetical protein